MAEYKNIWPVIISFGCGLGVAFVFGKGISTFSKILKYMGKQVFI